ncbi:MAG: PASTA domain-containing protein [Acidimicrobiia bacterium]|nr:PASTA domain-containing protein [Acidimicrobiia bacterium]MYC44587.1 PASTA domain-containing protein [Acidimicrobiia bacterium]MYI19949.1 PASTA domain-containing protein [Acidimicrobiia bacterium]
MDTGAVEPPKENAGNGVPEEEPGLLEGGDTGQAEMEPERSEEVSTGSPEEAAELPAGEPGETAWEPAPIAGRYRIGEYVAESRLGRTYRATDGDTGQDVEVTFLDAEAVVDSEDAAARLDELRTLRHLHVLPLLDWQLDPVPYLVHPAPAMRLQRLLESGTALTPSQTLLIGLQGAETLHSLRRSGVTHGAITPANCCVDVRGRLRLAEMGVDFLRLPLHPSEATRYDAPETIPVADLETPVAGDEAAETPVVVAEDETGEIPAVEGAADALAPAAGTGAAADPGEAPSADRDPVAEAAAADVYSLAVVLTDAAAGRPVAAAEISRLGRSMAPVGGGTATARNVARLAPLLAQASATRPENRLEADELALALRATAEMFPPPTRLDEAFRRAEEYEARPATPEPGEAGPATQPGRIRGLALRSVAAAAVVVAAALLVIFSAPGDDTPARAVPGVVGMDWSEASETLATSGWDVRRLDVRVPGASPGEVVGQLPSQGGLLDEGQTVKVQVSLGEPLVVIPADIVGMTVEEAGLRLSEIGLRVGIVQTTLDPAVPEGSVVAVNEMLPELPRGSAVDLVVAVGG